MRTTNDASLSVAPLVHQFCVGVLTDVMDVNINPSDVLEDSEQVKLVTKAINLVESFVDQLEDSGIIEEY